MNSLLCIGILSLAILQDSAPQKQSPVLAPQLLLTQADAAHILGEKSSLADSTTVSANGVKTYRCSFQAASENRDGRVGNIYFLYEEYEKLSLAQKKYNVTRTANEDNGIIVLEDLGEEAYFHTDNVNFYFIMVRKGNKVIIMKVNKITSTTSLDEFHRVARKITDAL